MKTLGPVQGNILFFLRKQKEGASKYRIMQGVIEDVHNLHFTEFTQQTSFNTYSTLKALEKRNLVYRDTNKKWWAK